MVNFLKIEESRDEERMRLTNILLLLKYRHPFSKIFFSFLYSFKNILSKGFLYIFLFKKKVIPRTLLNYFVFSAAHAWRLIEFPPSFLF